MKRVIGIMAAVGIIALVAVAGFAYVLYKSGEEIHIHRCGCHERDFD